MQKNYLLTLFILFISLFSFAQQTPIDFSQSNHAFTAFDGSNFAQRSDPQNGNNTVGEFFNDGTNAWQGFFMNLSRDIDLDNEKVVTLSFYAFDPNQHSVTIKLEQGTNADVEVTQTITSPAANTWIDLNFDFANATVSGTSNTTNATGTYSRITIFIDGGATAAGTYLLDDINDGSAVTDPNAIDVVYDVLVWSDEFDTNGAVDNTKWHHQTFGPNGGRWFNNELQHYTDSQDNSFVFEGFLNIVAKRENITQDGVTLDFSSARLNSKFAFTYGRVDVRAKLPEGNGTWPAIWTLGTNITETGAWFETQGLGTTPWPACGEIDIMEHGLHDTNEVSWALHTLSSSGNTIKHIHTHVSRCGQQFSCVFYELVSPIRLHF